MLEAGVVAGQPCRREHFACDGDDGQYDERGSRDGHETEPEPPESADRQCPNNLSRPALDLARHEWYTEKQPYPYRDHEPNPLEDFGGLVPDREAALANGAVRSNCVEAKAAREVRNEAGQSPGNDRARDNPDRNTERQDGEFASLNLERNPRDASHGWALRSRLSSGQPAG